MELSNHIEEWTFTNGDQSGRIRHYHTGGAWYVDILRQGVVSGYNYYWEELYDSPTSFEEARDIVSEHIG